jgi:hypothetical protein
VSFQLVKSFREVENRPTKYHSRTQLAALSEIPEKALKGDALSHQIVYVKSGQACPLKKN